MNLDISSLTLILDINNVTLHQKSVSKVVFGELFKIIVILW